MIALMIGVKTSLMSQWKRHIFACEMENYGARAKTRLWCKLRYYSCVFVIVYKSQTAIFIFANSFWSIFCIFRKNYLVLNLLFYFNSFKEKKLHIHVICFIVEMISTKFQNLSFTLSKIKMFLYSKIYNYHL